MKKRERERALQPLRKRVAARVHPQHPYLVRG